jgi:hypothetical protein
LTGAHRSAPCAACHPTVALRPDATPTVKYKPLPVTCDGCHADQHQGQFMTKAGAATAAPDPNAAAGATGTAADCSFCHKTDRFKPTLFSHDDPQFTSFTLRGKHATLACDACHRQVAVAPNVSTVRYRPLPSRCDECHVDFHHGDFRGFEPKP